MIAQYRTVNDWGAGFQGEIALTNAGAEPVTGWRLRLAGDFDLAGLWGARIVSREGGVLTLDNLSWNASIPPGGQVSSAFRPGVPG